MFAPVLRDGGKLRVTRGGKQAPPPPGADCVVDSVTVRRYSHSVSDADTADSEGPACEPVHLPQIFPTASQKAIYEAADKLLLYRTHRKVVHLREAEKMPELAMALADKITGNRNCPGCDKPFTAADKDNLYRSNKCRQRAFRLKRREASHPTPMMR
jgi:hypothetical protein